MCLEALGHSLEKAFGDALKVQMLPGELKLTLAGKSAWFNELGGLTGEASRICRTRLEVGVDEVSAGVSSTGTSIMPSV